MEATFYVPNPYPTEDEVYRESWLPSSVHSRPSRVPAQVTSFGLEASATSAQYSVQTLLKPRLLLRLPATECLSSAGEGSDELWSVPTPGLNVPAVSLSLAQRALGGRCVTRVTPSMWLSLNPCRLQVDHAGVSLQDVLYMARTRAQTLGSLSSAGAAPAGAPAPHIFEVAEGALGTLQALRTPSALVFTGEAGSGKSEAYKAALSYLAAIPALEQCGIHPACMEAPSASAGALLSSKRSRRDLLLSLSSSGGGGSGSDSSASNTAALGRCLLLADPDLELAAREASRRRGPLGTIRNPWFTFPSMALRAGGGLLLVLLLLLLPHFPWMPPWRSSSSPPWAPTPLPCPGEWTRTE